jgi:cyclopropane-fatty-acyl-phospholipid synthase
LVELQNASITDDLISKMEIVKELHEMPIAINTKEANEQHYEVPAKFYTLCLGPNKKYSSGYWETLDKCTRLGRVKENGKWLGYYDSLDRSEEAMLDLYCERAGIVNGMKIVDLGCGWGSLTLHLAKRFPDCQITSISNSHSQKEYILSTAKERGYTVENIRVITCDVGRWEDESYAKSVLEGVVDNDRVCSIEM